MLEHLFIFKPVQWLGQGHITLSMISEELEFFTRWKVKSRDDSGVIECTQEIQVKGISESMQNHFIMRDFQEKSFIVEMENPAIGRVEGKGIIDDKVIGWEFRAPEIGFEGFEYYEKIGEDHYAVRAEFASVDDLRSIIKGKIWIKAEEKK